VDCAKLVALEPKPGARTDPMTNIPTLKTHLNFTYKPLSVLYVQRDSSL
jgi:hypothetical protein